MFREFVVLVAKTQSESWSFGAKPGCSDLRVEYNHIQRHFPVVMHSRGMPLWAIGRAACFKASITPRHLLQSVMEISALIVPESGGGCPFKNKPGWQRIRGLRWVEIERKYLSGAQADDLWGWCGAFSLPSRKARWSYVPCIKNKSAKNSTLPLP